MSKVNTVAQIVFACVVLASLGFDLRADNLIFALIPVVAALMTSAVGRGYWARIHPPLNNNNAAVGVSACAARVAFLSSSTNEILADRAGLLIVPCGCSARFCCPSCSALRRLLAHASVDRCNEWAVPRLAGSRAPNHVGVLALSWWF